MSVATKSEFTVAEYLAFERNSEFRHEYYQGEIREMTGGTRRHVLVTLNLYRAAERQLPESEYFVVAIDMRVKVNPSGLYTYPDVVIVKGDPEFEDDQERTLLNPILLMEVLSDSTEEYDRNEKFSLFQKMPGFQEYVLAAQDRPKIDHYVRNTRGTWDHFTHESLSETLNLQSMPCSIPLTTIYKKIQFALES
ncbi:MAG: hypothetical protein JWM11_6625 [Planctomycetaceae bacterium]|nr:hypothetical protein [Planctomycetaceae bacterium]